MRYPITGSQNPGPTKPHVYPSCFIMLIEIIRVDTGGALHSRILRKMQIMQPPINQLQCQGHGKVSSIGVAKYKISEILVEQKGGLYYNNLKILVRQLLLCSPCSFNPKKRRNVWKIDVAIIYQTDQKVLLK